ncbi:hypothetical protein J0S82_006545 [Galemys pyrenaicus]|uniref:Uncharacterized protein n=1 Tax=Galemys pyrenaicus TaxID=202257 RepID=A0A8J6APP6_GALPY|nr:hypothetical protein J0S82_006545 [Galemys pyrenaicus]
MVVKCSKCHKITVAFSQEGRQGLQKDVSSVGSSTKSANQNKPSQ